MELLFRKLDQLVRLSDREKAHLEDVLHRTQVRYSRGKEIVAQGEKPEFLHLFLEGWSARERTLPDGKQQVVGLLLGGDVCGLSPDLPVLADHSIIACTDVVTAKLRATDYRDLILEYEAVSSAFRWLVTLDQACQREWTVNVGRRSAVERLAALFCEMYRRQERLGLVQGSQVPFPINQTLLADIVALSPVHVNRVLQHMRDIGVVSFGGGHLTIHDLERLETLACFDATYLGMHFRPLKSTHAPLSTQAQH